MTGPVTGPVTGAATTVAGLLVAALSACSGSSLATDDGAGYVSGDGTVTIVDAADREEPRGEVAGENLSGHPVGLSELRGKVVVMPVWGSWCAPCRAEAPALAEAARDLEDDGVVFLGINTRDVVRDNATRFVDRFRLPYESIFDPDGETLLAFHGTLPPNSIPSFVVIDQQGRIAGRILGEASTSTLYGVVEDVVGQPLRAGS